MLERIAGRHLRSISLGHLFKDDLQRAEGVAIATPGTVIHYVDWRVTAR